MKIKSEAQQDLFTSLNNIALRKLDWWQRRTLDNIQEHRKNQNQWEREPEQDAPLKVIKLNVTKFANP